MKSQLLTTGSIGKEIRIKENLLPTLTQLMGKGNTQSASTYPKLTLKRGILNASSGLYGKPYATRSTSADSKSISFQRYSVDLGLAKAILETQADGHYLIVDLIIKENDNRQAYRPRPVIVTSYSTGGSAD